MVDDEDFEMLNTFKWWASNGRRTWYAVARIQRNGKSRLIRMHQFLVGSTRKVWADHRDSNSLNNQRANLRLCRPVQNGGNCRVSKNSRSGLKGVFWNKEKSKWDAEITVMYKHIHLGRFDSKIDAANAYDSAASLHFGDFALTNKIMGLI